MPQRTWIALAAAASLATCALHVVGGGPEFLAPALASNLSNVWKAAFSAVWHQVTAFLLLNGVFLAAIAYSNRISRGALMLVAAQNLAFAALFLGYGWVKLGTLFQLLQWVIFMCISGFLMAATQFEGARSR